MPRPPTATDSLPPGAWRVCAVALCGALLAQLDTTIVNVSLSTLASDLHTSLATIQWVTSAYLLALALVLPLNGWLVDRMGVKRLYLACFVGFTFSSALCGLACSARSLVALRIVQGLSAGLLAPLAQLTVARAAGRHMTRVAGYMSLPVLLAPVLGPIVAGIILQHASWRWLFLVNLPVGAIALLLAIAFLPADRQDTQPRRLDWVGLALLSPGLVMLLYGLQQQGTALGRALLCAALGLIAAFLWTSRHKGERGLIDLQLFRGKVFSSVCVTQFLSNGCSYAGQLLIPAFLIQACGRTPAQAGWMLAPLGVGMMMANPFAGTLTDWFGIRRVSSASALLTFVATATLPYLAMRGLQPWLLAPALFLRGAGMGGVGLPSMSAAYASVDRRKLAMASTSLNIAQRLGGPALTTLCASILAWQIRAPSDGRAVSTAYAWTFLLLCGLQALVFLATLRLPWRLDPQPATDRP